MPPSYGFSTEILLSKIILTSQTSFGWTLPLRNSQGFLIVSIPNTLGLNSTQDRIYWFYLIGFPLSHGTHSPDRRFDRSQLNISSSVSFSLLSLDTGVPHPEAENNPLVVPCLGKYVRGQIDGLACTVWEETLVVQLFDGMAKFYFVNWRSGTVFAVSFRIFGSFRLCTLNFSRTCFGRAHSLGYTTFAASGETGLPSLSMAIMRGRSGTPFSFILWTPKGTSRVRQTTWQPLTFP